jgi:hypothetical protein
MACMTATATKATKATKTTKTTKTTDNFFAKMAQTTEDLEKMTLEAKTKNVNSKAGNAAIARAEAAIADSKNTIADSKNTKAAEEDPAQDAIADAAAPQEEDPAQDAIADAAAEDMQDEAGNDDDDDGDGDDDDDDDYEEEDDVSSLGDSGQTVLDSASKEDSENDARISDHLINTVNNYLANLTQPIVITRIDEIRQAFRVLSAGSGRVPEEIWLLKTLPQIRNHLKSMDGYYSHRTDKKDFNLIAKAVFNAILTGALLNPPSGPIDLDEVKNYFRRLFRL